MMNSRPDNTPNLIEGIESKLKSRHNPKTDRQQLGEIFRLTIIQVKVWFILSVIAALLVFGFGLITTATTTASLTQVPVDSNPVSLIITIVTGMINTLFLVQLRAANRRLDTIRDVLLGRK